MAEFIRYFNECHSLVTKSNIIGATPAFKLCPIFRAKIVTSQWRSSFDKLSVTIRWNVLVYTHHVYVRDYIMQLEVEYDRARTRTELTKCLVGTAPSIVTTNGPKRCTNPSRYDSDTSTVQRASMYCIRIHLTVILSLSCRTMYLDLLLW